MSADKLDRETAGEAAADSTATTAAAAPAPAPATVTVADTAEATPAAPATLSAATAAAVAASEEGKRLYIGNIPFRATAKDLRGLLEGFDIESLTIPRTRTSNKNGAQFLRGAGYAFAQLTSKEEADRAVEVLKGKTLNEREVSVKIAQPPTPKPREPREPKSSKKDDAGAKESGSDATTANGADDKTKNRPKRTSPRVLLEQRPDSADTVFLSGIPRETTPEDVTELFKGLGIDNVSLAVARAKNYRSKSGRTPIPARAYAFVKFSTHEDQQKAVDEFNGKPYKEFELKVRVAKVDDKLVASDSKTEGSDAIDANAETKSEQEKTESDRAAATAAAKEPEAQAA